MYPNSGPIWHHISWVHITPFWAKQLTLHMLNWFKDYKRYIHISSILDFVWQKKIKFIMGQPHINVLPTLYCQYHSCWCPGDFRSRGISRHGIDQISQTILFLAWEESLDQGVSAQSIQCIQQHRGCLDELGLLDSTARIQYKHVI